MSGVAKVGDQGHGQCYAGHPDVQYGSPKEYTTEFVTGSSDVILNGMPVAIVGTIGIMSCGHTSQAMTGDSSVIVNGVPIHRLGDMGIVIEGPGDYTTITSSTDTYAG
jgi:uncharacterized Zn-binding protein involved in type VI secretion